MFTLALTKRYIPAVILIAIFVIGTNYLSHKMIKSNKEHGKIINISGKQRMLSQKLVIDAAKFIRDPLKVNKYSLQSTIDEVKDAQKYLLTKIFTKEIEEIYFKQRLTSNLNRYLMLFQNILDTKNKDILKSVRENSNTILIQLDSVVKEYEKYSTKQLQILNSYELYLMIATLVMLLLEIFFIFRPAAKQIDKKTSILETKEEYEQTVIESNNNAIIAIDWTGKITTYNKKAENIFGWSKDEMIGTRNLLNIIPNKYKELHTAAHKKYLSTGKSCGVLNRTHELEGINKEGIIFPIQISFGAKWKTKGAIVVASIVDISKAKEQTDMLVQQSKMASMGEMIGNIAHQWRQPLSAISSSASGTILEKELGILTDEELKVKLQGIIDKSQYLSQTIEDFRNFFKQNNEKEDFSVNKVIQNVENIVVGTLKISDIKLVKSYQEKNDLHCLGFSNELSQVIINIFNNAKDILLEKQSVDKIIKVCLTQKEDNIIIKIHDSAGGIPDDILPKIFEPYFTTKHQSQGTGIGLYMSSEIVQGHFNGRLTASNTKFKVNGKEYYGACFKIKIPIGITKESE